MGILDRLFGIADPEPAPPSTETRRRRPAAYETWDMDSPALAQFIGEGRQSAAGVSVSEAMALRNSTFFRAAHLISSAMGMLPTHLMRRTADAEGVETIAKAKDHPLYRILHKRPNQYQTAFEFKSYMQLLALLDGNAYALVVRGMARGRANQIIRIVPLKRKSVTPKLSDDDFQLTFEYRRPSGGTVILQQDQVFHFRHPITRDGLKGVSLIDMAVNAIGIAAQAEKAAGKVLKGGVMAGGALETDNELGPEAIEQLKADLRDRQADGEQAAEWLVLEEGLKAKPFTTAKDAQYDETRKRQAEEVSRFTGVPRPLLMFDETSWGSGIEQLGLFFVTYCLMPWFVAWEQAIERSCFTQAEQDADELYVKFNEGALLRGSLKDQADFFAKALGTNNGYRTQNEVRSAFDLNPIEGADKIPASSAKSTNTPKESADE